MRTIRMLAILTALALPVNAALAAAPQSKALAQALAGKLRAHSAIAPQTHTTDFGDDAIGCITLARWELADFGYRGHAFLCEEGATEEVLGAVLNRAGVVSCYITGNYVGDGCYDFSICDIAETACVQ